MDTETREKLIEKRENTPEDIQALILHEQYGVEIFVICEEAGVEDQEALDVEEVVTYVLLGEIKPKRFVPTLTKELGIPGNKARKIAREVYDSIFRSVEETLEEMYGLKRPLSDVLEESMGTDATKSQTQQEGQQEPPQADHAKTQPRDTAPTQRTDTNEGVQPTQQEAPPAPQDPQEAPRPEPELEQPQKARQESPEPTPKAADTAQELEQKPLSRRERARQALSGDAPEPQQPQQATEPAAQNTQTQPAPPENLPGQEAPASQQTQPTQAPESQPQQAAPSGKARPSEEAVEEPTKPSGGKSVIDEKLRRAREEQEVRSPAEEETKREDPYREPIE